MSRSVGKRKRRRRLKLPARPSERGFLGSDEARFRLAARLSLALGVGLLAAAIVLSYLLPRGSHALGIGGNLALRMAGVALVIVSLMFARLGKTR